MPSHHRSSAASFRSPRRPGLQGSLRLGLAALGVLLGGRALPLAAQASPPKPTDPAAPAPPCERIGRIDIRNNSLFSPEELQSKNFGWALGAVNAIHFRTRSDYLRHALQISEGSCLDQVQLAASVRNIRDLGFIARAEAHTETLPDSTVAVELETWDEWSTTASVNIDVENSLQFKGFLIAEKNAFGRGLKASFSSRTFREQRNNNFTLATTRLFDTPTQASIAGGTTRLGQFWRQDVWRPWQTEGPEVSYQSRIQYEDQEQAYLTGDLKGLTQVSLPRTDRTWNAQIQKRIGTRGALMVVGAEVDVLRRTISGPARLVFNNDFTTTPVAPDSITARLTPQANPDSWVKLGAQLGVRHIRFTTAKGLDLIDGTQNVALGTDVVATLGRALATWGTAPLSTYGTIDAYWSEGAGPFLFNAKFTADGRAADRSVAGESQWRDLTVGGRALLYFHPSVLETFVVGARVQAVRNLDQPYQITLGGADGVRGYNELELPAASTVVFSGDEKYNLPWFRPAIGLGLTAFADYGRAWAANVPFGVNTDWRASVGGGLRIAFPARSGIVTRLEIAWPVGPGAGSHGPMIRTYWNPVETRR